MEGVPGTVSTRSLVVDLDSVRQADLWLAQGRGEAVERLRAMVRTAVLLTDEIIVTDAQLLDGVFFLDLGPDGIAAALGLAPGAELPMRIVARDSDLSQALAQMCDAPGFEWSSRRVATEDSGRVDDVQRRQEWVRAAHTGRFPVESFHGKVFDFGAALERSAAPPEEVPAEIVQTLRGITRRSDVVRALGGGDPVDEAQRRAAYWWWDTVYADALAAQHGASWLGFGEQQGGRVSAGEPPLRSWRAGWGRLRTLVATAAGRSREPVGPGALRLDGTMLESMAVMPGPVFALVRYRAAGALARWRADPGRGTLNDVSFAVRSVADQTPRWRSVVAWTSVRAVFILTLALFVLVSGLMNPDSRSLPRWVLLAIGLFLSIPWGELIALVDVRPGKMRGVLHRSGT